MTDLPALFSFAQILILVRASYLNLIQQKSGETFWVSPALFSCCRMFLWNGSVTE